VFLHGGGFVIGDLETHDAVCRALTNRAQCVTLSVDYRLAPEHPAPAAGDDCYAATNWAYDNAKSLGVDPKRLAVGGDSAGGNLAAVVALMARDRSGPPIGFQLLIYPATNAAFDTYSHKTFTDYFLTHEDCVYFWNQYSPSEAGRADPYVSPARANSHRGLPPALIITAEFDPLRDEGEAYAEILRAAGGSAKATRYDGMIHGFYSMAGILDQAKAAIEESAAALRAAWRS
jgi:acetyl esterase